MSGQTRIHRCPCGRHWNLQYADGTHGLEFATQRGGLNVIMMAAAVHQVSLDEFRGLRNQVLDEVAENTDSVTEQKVEQFNAAVRHGQLDRSQVVGCELAALIAA
jgi:hypothetical protein